MIPKIKFKEMTLQENIDTIKWEYYEKNGTISVHDYTIQMFPELSNLGNNISKEIVYKKIEEVVTKEYEKNIKKIKNETEKYNRIWEKYNDKYFKLLMDFLDINWPDNEIIVGTVGLIPVFPRNLDTFSFSVSIGLEDWFLTKTCAHETLHFLWFEKWKQIHPETPRKEFECPYITWQYSEMVTDPILNNKPFSDLFGKTFIERGYDSFYKLYDGDNLVMDNLRKIYSEDIPVEDKINKGFEYINNFSQNLEQTKTK